MFGIIVSYKKFDLDFIKFYAAIVLFEPVRKWLNGLVIDISINIYYWL
jgi:hypothetical protein